MSLIKRERRSAWPLETVWPQDLVDGAFRDMFKTFFNEDAPLERMFGGNEHLMRVEEFLDGETCVIRAELPGIDPEKDVEITVNDGILRLHAERQQSSEEDRPDGYRSEFHYGSLTRSLRLPKGATEADITASYKDGILEVRVPAPQEIEAAAATTIPVMRG